MSRNYECKPGRYIDKSEELTYAAKCKKHVSLPNFLVILKELKLINSLRLFYP